MSTVLNSRPLAVVTGASSGIGLELARCCAAGGFDLVIAADEPGIQDVVAPLTTAGAAVEAVQADLATQAGVDLLAATLRGRPVAALLANAGRGLGHAFLDQDFNEIRKVIDTNLTGTLDLIYRIGSGMRQQGQARILIT